MSLTWPRFLENEAAGFLIVPAAEAAMELPPAVFLSLIGEPCTEIPESWRPPTFHMYRCFATVMDHSKSWDTLALGTAKLFAGWMSLMTTCDAETLANIAEQLQQEWKRWQP